MGCIFTRWISFKETFAWGKRLIYKRRAPNVTTSFTQTVWTFVGEKSDFNPWKLIMEQSSHCSVLKLFPHKLSKKTTRIILTISVYYQVLQWILNSVARHCTSDTQLSEMWSQIYFVLGLIFYPYTFQCCCSKAHIDLILQETFRK